MRTGIAQARARRWNWRADAALSAVFVLMIVCVLLWPVNLLIKLAVAALYVLLALVPATGQFFVPAAPVIAYLLLFFSCRYIPLAARERIHIWVSVLPTLESVLYGANISDILTRYTNPLLDVVAWLPYGVGHFVLPFVTAGLLFVFGGPGALKFFGNAFGYMNIIAVTTQILFPCAPPWYELLHGITPASYAMQGAPGGLARIDKLFHSHGYTDTFTNSPMVFGAFPSLHAADVTLEALFLSHYFPRGRVVYWTYAFVLYWSTMYLTHHYLIDLVAGGSFAIAAFYTFLTDDQRHLPMVHAHAAGEDAAVAKGYRSDVQGLVGHRGANGLWTADNGGQRPADGVDGDGADHGGDDDGLARLAGDHIAEFEAERSARTG